MPLNFVIGPYQAVDVAVGVLIPIHFHLVMDGVVIDYVYGPARKLANIVLYGVSAVTLLGLLKLNTHDEGITNTIKSLWEKK